MLTTTEKAAVEFIWKELENNLMTLKSGGLKVHEPTYFKIGCQPVPSKEPLPTENFLVFKNSIGNKPNEDQPMLTKDEHEVAPSTRRANTLLKSAAVEGGKLGHYLSSSIFEATILQYGPLAEMINDIYRRTDIPDLQNMQILLSKIHG